MTNLRRHTLVTLLITSFAAGAAVAATDIKAPAAPAASTTGAQLAPGKETPKSVASTGAPHKKMHHKKMHHKKAGKAEPGKKAEPAEPTQG